MSTDGRTTRPSDELLAHPNEKPQQNRPSVGARGFEPLSLSEDESASTKHNTEAGRPNPDSELLAHCPMCPQPDDECCCCFGSRRWDSANLLEEKPLMRQPLGVGSDHYQTESCAARGCVPVPSGLTVAPLSPSERSEDANPHSSNCRSRDIGGGGFCTCVLGIRRRAQTHTHDLLSLEDRLLVALSKRGDMSIGEFIEFALYRWEPDAAPSDVPDDEFVLALEQYEGTYDALD